MCYRYTKLLKVNSKIKYGAWHLNGLIAITTNTFSFCLIGIILQVIPTSKGKTFDSTNCDFRMPKSAQIRGASYLVSGEDIALSDDMVFTSARFTTDSIDQDKYGSKKRRTD